MDSRFRGNDGDRVSGHWVMHNQRTEQAHALDTTIAANLKELEYGE